jgi:hypothetical protein
VKHSKTRTLPLRLLTAREEAILRTVYTYRYMTALDVAHRLFSPTSLTHVREILTRLAGGEDFKTHQYLYRFCLPTPAPGGRERIYTLGVKGRDFLSEAVGVPVDWYFRPHKLKHLSYSLLVHNLLLTRVLVAAHRWSRQRPDFRLLKMRTCYELAQAGVSASSTKPNKGEVPPVVPDAWLLFERLKDGAHEHDFPVLLEIDRGREYREKFKRHVRTRLEWIASGQYREHFGTPAVLIAYLTTGQRPEYRESRRQAMCQWTREVLREQRKENWAGVFRFRSVEFEKIYQSALFEAPLWYRPDSDTPMPLWGEV